MSTWSASLDTGTLTMDASTDADKQAWRSLLSHLHPATISLHADEALRLLRADVAHADATLAALVDGSAKCGLVSSMLVRVYDRALLSATPAGWATPSRARARVRCSRSPAARPTCRRATPARRPRCGARSYAVASP